MNNKIFKVMLRCIVYQASDLEPIYLIFEPPNNAKDVVARMLFYLAVRYESDDGVNLELNDLLNNGNNSSILSYLFF
jgi:hypothetical protein